MLPRSSGERVGFLPVSVRTARVRSLRSVAQNVIVAGRIYFARMHAASVVDPSQISDERAIPLFPRTIGY